MTKRVAALAWLVLAFAVWAADYATFRGDSARTGQAAKATAIPVEPLFAKGLGAPVTSSCVKWENRFIVGLASGDVVGVDAFSGDVAWTLATGGQVVATAAVHDGKAFIPSSDGHLYVADARSGALIKKVKTESETLSSPLVLGDRVYVGLGYPSNRIVAYTLDLEVASELELSQPVHSSLALAGQKLVFGSNDQKVHALDPGSFAVKWSRALGAEARMSVPASDGTRAYVFVGDARKTVYALNPDDGTVAWQQALVGDEDMSKSASVALLGERVYVLAGNTKTKLYALDKNTGAILWNTGDLGKGSDFPFLSSPLVFGSHVAVTTPGGKLQVYDTAGTLVQDFSLSSGSNSSPCAASGLLAAADSSGTLHVFRVQTDATNPTASIQKPAAGETVGKAFEAVVSGDDAHFKQITVQLGEGASPASWTTAMTIYREAAATSVGKVTTAAPGTYTLRIITEDVRGNTAEATATFTSDHTPPTLSVTEPVSGLLTNAKEVTVKGATDGVKAWVQGLEAAIAADGTFSAVVALVEGENKIKVVAENHLTNQAEVEITVQADRQAPVLALSEPAENLLTNSSKVTVAGTVNKTVASLTVQGSAVSVAGDGSFSTTLTLPDGTHDIIVAAKDPAGNQSTVTRKVSVDTTAPSLTVAYEGATVHTNQESYTVTGSVEAGVALTVNGTAVTPAADGSFSHAVTLAKGTNEVSVEAKDAAGNSTLKKITVAYDAEGPALAVTSPKEGAILNTATIRVSGKAEGAVSVEVNGVLATLDAEANFSAQVSLASVGTNTITVVAQDAVGNTSSLQLPVSYYDQAPDLVVTEPTAGAILNTAQVKVAGSADAQTAVSLTVNGEAVFLAADGSFSTVLTLADGAHTVQLIAADLAGNKRQVDLAVTIDTKAPTRAEIAVPFTPWVVDTRDLSLSVTAADNDGGSGVGSILLSESSDFASATTCEPAAGVSTCAFTLSDSDGKKTLYVRVRDRAGNTLEGSQVVVLDRESFVRVSLADAQQGVTTGDGTVVMVPPGAFKVKEKEGLFLVVRDPLKLGQTLPPSDPLEALGMNLAREVLVVDAAGDEVAVELNSPITVQIPYSLDSLDATVAEERLRVYRYAGPQWELLTGFQQRVPNAKKKTASAVEAQSTQLGLFRLMEVVIGNDQIAEVFNFPNPFSTTTGTSISYRLKQDVQRVEFDIYTSTGRKVTGWQVFAGEKGALIGRNRVKFSGTTDTGRVLANGVYLYRVKVVLNGGETASQVGKLVVLR